MGFFDVENPFKPSGAFGQKYAVYDSSQARDASRASMTEETLKGYVYAGEPQRVSRVTTNLLAIGDDVAMQVSAYEIFTDETDIEIEKNDTMKNLLTEKTYKVVSPEKSSELNGTWEWNLMVTEYDD